jgi:hypothetical protein
MYEILDFVLVYYNSLTCGTLGCSLSLMWLDSSSGGVYGLIDSELTMFLCRMHGIDLDNQKMGSVLHIFHHKQFEALIIVHIFTLNFL